MDLVKIINTPDSERDEAWENLFFQALSNGLLNLLSPDPQQGPDGWPYLLVSTDGETKESAQGVLQWLATRGIGLVVNPAKEYPDYVFTYGMIWSFRETGFFYKRIDRQDLGKVEYSLNTLVHAGSPTPQYLPDYVRKVLRDFFRDQNVLLPKILVVSTDRVNYDLAFSLESLGLPGEQEHQGILEAISWFLPPHYSIVLVSEKGMPPFLNL